MINVNPNLSETTFDVIVIGAGINGAGIARDAAMRGLKVLLLDKGDVGGGTSSWSTRLIHGGLRYLEHGEFGLVRESLRERSCLMKIAPHLVRPLPMLVPIYHGGRRGPWTMRAGMIAYDLLSFDKTLPRHQMLSRTEALDHLPALNPDGLEGGAIFYDGQVEFAERLVFENALSAIEHSATVLTYARVDKLIVAAGKIRGIEFTQEHDNARQSVRAEIVVNAAGPWVDQLLEKTGANSPRLIGGTKGSHIIVAPFPGAPSSAVYVEAETDQRPFFIIPWNSNYLIGTTDIRYDGDLDNVRIESDEIDYLLRETNRIIPLANLSRDKILFTYAGVRPLPFTGDKGEAGITRRHFLRRHPQAVNLFSIVGGKLTTYRSLAEEAVDLVFKEIGRSAPTCATDKVPLPGAGPQINFFEDFCRDFKLNSGLSPITSERLLRIYGTRSAEIVKLTTANPSLAKIFDEETRAIAAEVIYSFDHEFASSLADCLLRRTMVGLNSSCGLDAIEPAATIARNHLSWTNERFSREVSNYRKVVGRFRLRSRPRG
ncbi:MAG TPA: glycerol-3-phosphate dehydrogenase [Pyrinomonadaceae bacterium]|nr:glycerol-3-phosphate dehydrogenase [Pyrinomonadaceae bacterium]